MYTRAYIYILIFIFIYIYIEPSKTEVNPRPPSLHLRALSSGAACSEGPRLRVLGLYE